MSRTAWWLAVSMFNELIAQCELSYVFEHPLTGPRGALDPELLTQVRNGSIALGHGYLGEPNLRLGEGELTALSGPSRGRWRK